MEGHPAFTCPADDPDEPLFGLFFSCGALSARTLAHVSPRMASSQNTKPETQPAPVAGAAMTSCRKKKSESASFIEDLKDHADEFFNASWDEHKTCFQKTVNKMFASLKNVTEKSSVTAGPKEVESALPLQTTVSK